MLKKVICIVTNIIITFAIFYCTLPPINIHSPGFWWFLIIVSAIWLISCFACFHDFSIHNDDVVRKTSRVGRVGEKTITKIIVTSVLLTIFLPILIAASPLLGIACLLFAITYFVSRFARNRLSAFNKFVLNIVLGGVVVFVILLLFSSPIFSSQRYRDVANIVNSGTLKDVFEPIVDVSELDVLTMQSSSRVGDRILGQMAQKYISQFEVNNEYNLIYLGSESIRVTPLEYGSFFKWINNKSKGIPAYLKVSITSQASSLEDLNKPIKYAPSAYFNDDLIRHLRFKHPTKILGKPQFELNDFNVPYYIVPTKTANAGLFGALHINGAILCNANSGEMDYYDINNVPEWVDHVYSVSDINDMTQWYYNYVHGYFNFSKKDMRNTSYHYDSYQYNTIARDGDIHMITGITSVGNDESNVGFIMANLRTGDISYYDDPGAEESSAQGSAEGLVQQYGYKAAPPKLVNIDGASTYYMPLYDSQGVFRKYAFVNKMNFTLATEADTLQEAYNKYKKLIQPAMPQYTYATKGTISQINTATVDGNTYFYYVLQNDDTFYISSIINNSKQVVLKVGDTVTIEYTFDEKANGIVSSIDFTTKLNR